MEITIADTVEQFATIERLARRIVPEFYAPYFSRSIGEYLVESGHTAVALSLQADKGYQHFLIGFEGKAVGYFSLGPVDGSGLGSGGSASDGLVGSGTVGSAGSGASGALASGSGGSAGSGASLRSGASGTAGSGASGALSSARTVGLLLSHFYILPEYRGRGLGRMAMEFIDRRVAEMGAGRVELFVLRENVGAVRHYLRNGYTVQDEVLTRLGNGAILEDYLMRKEVGN